MASLPHGWHHNVEPPSTTKKPNPPQRPSLTSQLKAASHTGTRSSMLGRKIPVRVNGNSVNGAIPNITEVAEPPLINGKEANGHHHMAGMNGFSGTPKPRARWNIPASGSVTKTSESMQMEIANMKKELANLRDENNQLKTRLRRLSDDNAKKAKQIEKLLMSGQEESLGNERKKVPSAESVPVLRQKCSRLEASLKEKEAIIKKLQSDRMAKMQETKSTMDGYQKEITNLKNQINKLTSNGPKTNAMSGTWTQRSRAGASQPANKAIAAENNSIEVARLRDMLHKLQQDNQKIAQQLKEKNQELKQLKVQLQKSTQPIRAATLHPQTAPATAPHPSGKAKSPEKITPSMSTTKDPRKAIPQTRSNILKTNAARSKLQEAQLSDMKKPSPSSLQKKTSLSAPSQLKNNASLVKKQSQNATGKLQKATARTDVKSVAPTNELIESKVRELRENVAAKKIQRSWRSHRQKHSTLDSEEQAILLLQSTFRGHKVRMDHLGLLPKDCLMLDSEEDVESATEALHKLTSEYP